MTQFFPTIAPNITADLYGAIAKESALHGQSWKLPPRVAVGVANWLGRRTVEYQPAPPPRIVPGMKRPPGALADLSAQRPTAQPGGAT